MVLIRTDRVSLKEVYIIGLGLLNEQTYPPNFNEQTDGSGAGDSPRAMLRSAGNGARRSRVTGPGRPNRAGSVTL